MKKKGDKSSPSISLKGWLTSLLQLMRNEFLLMENYLPRRKEYTRILYIRDLIGQLLGKIGPIFIQKPSKNTQTLLAQITVLLFFSLVHLENVVKLSRCASRILGVITNN